MAQSASRITIRQLVEEYLALQCTRPVTQSSVRYHLAGLLALYGGWQARRLKPQHMADYLAAVVRSQRVARDDGARMGMAETKKLLPSAGLAGGGADEPYRRAGVSPATAVHRAKLLRTVLRWGVSSGRLSANPLEGLRLPMVRARRVDPPSTTEARRMYKAAAPHVRRVIVIGMAAGPRIGPSELFRLRWCDVDLTAGIIRMPNAHKGAREESRLVPVRDDVLPLLRQWAGADAARECPWVIHWQGRPVRCIGHAWHAARRAAGITRRITPYSLRHAMPTEALEHGADVKAVAEVMGHADPTMLLRVYQHTRYRLRKKAVNAAPGLGIKSEAP